MKYLLLTLLVMTIIGCDHSSQLDVEAAERTHSDQEALRDGVTRMVINGDTSGARDLIDRMIASAVKSDVAFAEHLRDSMNEVFQSFDANKVARMERAKQLGASVLKRMKVDRDDFKGITWYYPPYTYGSTASGIYIYCGQKDDGLPWARLVIRYKGDNWLFAKSAEVKAGGRIWNYSGGYSDWKRDNGGGRVWEWLDIPLKRGDQSMVDALVASGGMLRITGDKYYHDVKLTRKSIDGLQLALQCLTALGGDLSALPE